MNQDTINIGEIFQMVLRHIKLIILTTVIAALVFFSYAYFFIVPIYSSSGIIQIQNTDNYISSANVAKENDKKIYVSDIEASANLAKNCVLLFTMDSDMVALLNGANLSIDQINESYFLRFTVVSKDKTTIQPLANNVLEKSVSIFKETFSGAGKIDIKSAASPAFQTNKTAAFKTTVMGVLLGLIIGIIIAVFKEIIDSTIKPDDDLYERYDIPVFAEILDFQAVAKKGKSSRRGR